MNTRIIPARAGFTSCGAGLSAAIPDHPRSRGVYASTVLEDLGPSDHPRSRGVYFDLARLTKKPYGSSPLARGLPDRSGVVQRGRRIIPARAGFTPACGPGAGCAPDHPRSRGVYTGTACARLTNGGSSPLARGLLDHLHRVNDRVRIIPARAGFTPNGLDDPSQSPDHPRSRGVYTCGSLESQRRGTLPDCVCLHCRPSARSAEFR